MPDIGGGISLLMPLVGASQADLKKLDKGVGSASFTRATTATFKGSNGLIQTAASGDLREEWGANPRQRLAYSEDFTQSIWTKSNVTVSSDNATAPNGKAVAQALTASAGNATCLQAIVDTSRARYGSIYLKRKTGTGSIQVTLDGGSTWTTVTINSSSWTRVGASQTLVNPSFGVRIVTSGDAVYAWGAQLEDGAAATRYRKTGAQTLVPLGVLIEGQRTNLTTYSEQFDNAAWNKGEASISANVTAAPDGNMTADKLVESSAVGQEHQVFKAVTLDDNAAYSLSVFAKPSERSWINLRLNDKAGTRYDVWFNLSSGTIGTIDAGVTASIESFPGGWHRCSIRINSVGTGAGGAYVSISANTADGQYTYNGDGTSGIYLWGGQYEIGSFPSSYIPTVAAAVTRNADNLQVVTSGNISGIVGTVSCIFAQSDSASGNKAIIGINATGNGTPMLIYLGKLSLYDGTIRTGASLAVSDTVQHRGTTSWGGVASLNRPGFSGDSVL